VYLPFLSYSLSCASCRNCRFSLFSSFYTRGIKVTVRWYPAISTHNFIIIWRSI